jgi:hypothetical protein
MLFLSFSLLTIKAYNEEDYVINRIKAIINQAIENNRKEWIALITYGYGAHYSSTWHYFGYQSKYAYTMDLQQNLQQLPTLSNAHS